MDLLQAIVLGLVQGLTEYLPVSSSAHLVLVPALLGWAQPSFAFDVVVQLGTLAGVFVYFRAELLAILRSVFVGLRRGRPLHDADARIGWLVVVASVPAGVTGLVWKDDFERAFQDPRQNLWQLIVTGLMMLVAEGVLRVRARRALTIAEALPGRELNVVIALIMGFMQALAILPGISRSGATIAGGVVAGLTRKQAATFSFLMSVPVMLGAGLLELKDLVREPSSVGREGGALAAATVVAAVSGYVVIRWFLGFLGRRSLAWFALYVIALGGVGLTTELFAQ